MTNEDATSVDPRPDKPILEQILDEMYAQLAGHPDISEETLDRLQRLAQTGQLKKPDKVTEAIKSTTRNHHETDRA